MPNSTQLFQVEELPDLYVDACVCDEQRNLVFLSAWGRDTVIQEFLARLTLGTAENGIDQFHITVGGHRLPVFPNPELLEKRTTRQFRGTLFGSLLHIWLFDRRASAPDRANHFAFALLKPDEDPRHRLWPLVMETCPLPLLQHWREPVMKLLTEQQMLSVLPGAVGTVCGYRLALRTEALELTLGALIRDGHLTTDAPACA